MSSNERIVKIANDIVEILRKYKCGKIKVMAEPKLNYKNINHYWDWEGGTVEVSLLLKNKKIKQDMFSIGKLSIYSEINEDIAYLFEIYPNGMIKSIGEIPEQDIIKDIEKKGYRVLIE
jgi:hypothetical protein